MYKDMGLLGSGGQGSVRLAKFLPTGEMRALKIFHKPLDPAHRAPMVAAVRRRCIVLYPLQLVCKQMAYFYEVLEGTNSFFMTMELCAGDLDQLVRLHGRLQPNAAAHFVALTLRTLALLHAHGVVHRDVKPHNIFVRDLDDPLSLCIGDYYSAAICQPGSDFDPAQNLPADDESSEFNFAATAALATVCGTPLYMAPEIVGTRRYGPKVDVWSVGVMLYWMLSGRTPFEHARNFIELYKAIARADYVIPEGAPEGAKALLGRLLAVDPADRPGAAEALLDPWLVAEVADLERVADDQKKWPGLAEKQRMDSGAFDTGPFEAMDTEQAMPATPVTAVPTPVTVVPGTGMERAALSGVEVQFVPGTGELEIVKGMGS
ncbi:kinase-like domain-containing protein [Hyaloraphidium curvatum]|nr:kinase-like domain-containing protein [Hyaloraphidium curvatum]